MPRYLGRVRRLWRLHPRGCNRAEPLLIDGDRPLQAVGQQQMHADIAVDDMTHETFWRRLLRWLVDGVPDQVTTELPQDRVETDELVIPREAMGFGDVKFMAAIGAFIGWQGALFSLMASAVVGAVVGVGVIAIGRRDWSARLPYGP